ncbi:MAG: hypothetical protein J7K89_06565 [Candidatus Cloacimonetes bacterium]|nr:hypothetical protein [Candidatus Cloacimonadota bacterium]
MLREILALFNQRITISSVDLAVHFGVDKPAMDAMLEQLVRKERIQPVVSACSGCSGHCGSCSFASQKELFTLKK